MREPYRIYFYDAKILKGFLEYHFFFKPHPYSRLFLLSYFFFFLLFLTPSLFSLLSSFFFLILLFVPILIERAWRQPCERPACDQRERAGIGALATPFSCILKTTTFFNLKISLLYFNNYDIINPYDF